MASISRFVSRSLLRKWSNNTTLINVARISTSQKDKDTTLSATPQLFKDDLPEKFDAQVTNKHWVSWGYDFQDREKDVTFIHLFFFTFVTICIVGGSYYTAYIPAKNFRDWSQREAYLLIREREAAGVPLIDRDLVPAENFELPSDEELGEMSIII